MAWRKPLLVLLTLALFAAVAIVATDFLQLGWKIPPLVAPEDRVDLIRVDKARRTLTLLRGDNVVKTYQVSLGAAPSGRKLQEGDGRTPEGRYVIDSRNPRSRFHLALHVSYPDATDHANAQRRGVSPGGDIMVHGLPNGLGWLDRLHLSRDWTDGCIAVTNQEMDEIWAHVATGTPIEITP
jgi:murein L,D-transpeptidase YafK